MHDSVGYYNYAATGIDYTPPSFFQATFLATTPSPTNMSQTFVIAILTDDVLEDLELFEVVVSDVNSLYVVCDSEADCTTQVVIEQEGSDCEQCVYNYRSTDRLVKIVLFYYSTLL